MLGKKIFWRVAAASLCVITAFGVWSCDKSDGSSNKIWFRSGNDVSYEAGRHIIEVVSETGWTLSVSYEDSSAGEWCTLNVSSGTGSGIASLSYEENPGETRTADLTAVFDDGDRQTIRLTQQGSGQGGTLDVYLELPALPGNGTLPDSLRFVTHYVPGNQDMRSYSILYDVVNHIPVWVAYPMHSIYVRRDVGRTDAWQFDPLIDRTEQPDLYRAMGNGYSRGHMLPSASRYLRWGDSSVMSTNEQTFFYTNMTAQNSDFNGNIWANMESYVRGWNGSGADTLYVVTGAVLRTVGGNEEINYTFSRNDPARLQMAIPNYYYKALVKRSVNGDDVKFKGVAFWFEHRSYDRTAIQWSDAITIDELQKRTGIDFFSGLESQVQEQIESQRNPTDWGFRAN